MQDRWDFYNPVKIAFGAGMLRELARLIPEGRLLLVTTQGFTRRGITDQIIKLIPDVSVSVLDTVQPNPDLASIENDVSKLDDFDGLIALGGGSAIDSAKAINAAFSLRAGGSTLRRHLEHGEPLPACKFLPLIAIPTTAGTGSEVTSFATVWDRDAQRKYSVSGPQVFPVTAVLDPILTLSMPRATTIATGLDALSHALESIWNRHANTLTLSWSRRALGIALNVLPAVVEDLKNLGHRARMMEASLVAGLAISSTRTALAHSISYPITLRWGVPHGLACSFTLPAVLRWTAEADDGRLTDTVACLGYASIEALRETLLELLMTLQVPALLRRYIPDPRANLSGLVSQMYTPDRAGNMWRTPSTEVIASIIQDSVNSWPNL